MVPHLLQIEMGVGYYHMHYNIASLVVGIGSFVEEYLKNPTMSNFALLSSAFMSALLVNATICPTGVRSKRGRGAEWQVTSRNTIEILWQKQNLKCSNPNDSTSYSATLASLVHSLHCVWVTTEATGSYKGRITQNRPIGWLARSSGN